MKHLDRVKEAIEADDLNSLRCCESWILSNRDARIKGQSLVFYATFMGSMRALRFLAESGLSLRERDEDGDTLLHQAAGGSYIAGRRPSIIRLLIEMGLNVDARNSRWGRTPLAYAAGFGHEDGVRELVKHGADVRACDHQGRSVIQYAATPENSYVPSLSLIRFLVENGADAREIYDYDRCIGFMRQDGGVDFVPRRMCRNDMVFSPGAAVLACTNKNSAAYERTFLM